MCDLEYGYMGFTRNIIKIKGQTYQNLSNNIEYKGSGDWPNVYNISENGTYTFKSDNKAGYITIYDKSAKYLLKENSVYTLVFDIDTDFVNYKGICINGNEDGYFDQSTNIYLKDLNTTLTNGSYKFKFTVGSVTNMFAIGFRVTTSITSGTYFRAYNFKLLEGDYTDTDLPTSINGIESACENENNVLLLKGNSITLPQPLRSLPNGVCDELVGNKLIQRVDKIIVDGTNNISISEVRDNTIRFYIIDSRIKKSSSPELSFLCDSLPKTGKIWNYDEEGIYQDTNGNRFVSSILKSKLTGTTINDIKAYFSENPMTIYYELAAPIEHTIDTNIKKIKKSKCYNKIKPTII